MRCFDNRYAKATEAPTQKKIIRHRRLIFKGFDYLCSPQLKMRTIGEMLEWLKRHAWKACGLLQGLASSNLALSANF